MRAVLLALLSLACAAPAAVAAEGPDHLPVYGARDGVTLTPGSNPRLHFGAKARTLYATLRNRRAYSMCGAFTEGLNPDHTARRGLGTLPAKRGSVPISTGGHADVCVLATRPVSNEADPCQPLRSDLPNWCARVVVALTDRGGAYIDRLARSLELWNAYDQLRSLPPDWAPTPLELIQGALSAEVVGLAGPDDSPPPGKLGLYGDAENHTFAVLLRDGTRRFLRREGDVVTTNVPELLGRPLTVFPS